MNQSTTQEALLNCENKIKKFRDLFKTEREKIQPHTLTAVQVPPVEPSLGPRVEHISMFTSGLLSEIIANELDAPQWFVLELMKFGAVYYCPIIPWSHNTENFVELSEDKKDAIFKIHQAAVQLHGPDPRLKVIGRVLGDISATAGSYCRVHVHPKRFPMVYKVDWKSRIILETEQFVAVNKPRGVQVPPTVDNIIESTIAQVEKVIDFEGQLLNVHRLDRETEGIVLLAKTSEFASTLQEYMMGKDGSKSIEKYYKALTRSAPPLGQLTHYLKVGQRQKGEPSHTHVFDHPIDGAQQSQLIIQKVEEVQLVGEAKQRWGETGFESTILLQTGRTHQIRSQLAHIKCPLLGDMLYNYDLDNYIFKTQDMPQAKNFSDTGLYPLQAHEMVIYHGGEIQQCEDPLKLQAGVPWWRDQQKFVQN